MQNSIGENLTHAFGGRIDFFNIGGLFKQRAQGSFVELWNHYSWRELFIRGGLVTTAIVAGVFSATTCDSPECSPIMRGLVGGSVGFFVAHAAVIIPTIQRRNKIIHETRIHYDRIGSLLDSLEENCKRDNSQKPDILDQISALKDDASFILNLKIPVQKKGDAVKNLITIKNRMKALEEDVVTFVESLSQSKNHRL